MVCRPSPEVPTQSVPLLSSKMDLTRLSIKLDGSFGSCKYRVKLLVVRLKRFRPPSFNVESLNVRSPPCHKYPVPIQIVPCRSSYKAVTLSKLKVLLSLGLCLKRVIVPVFGSMQFKPACSVPTHIFPSRSSR